MEIPEANERSHRNVKAPLAVGAVASVSYTHLDVYKRQAIMLSGVAAMGFWQFYQYRMKSGLFFGALAAFGAITFAVNYIMATM